MRRASLWHRHLFLWLTAGLLLCCGACSLWRLLLPRDGRRVGRGESLSSALGRVLEGESFCQREMTSHNGSESALSLYLSSGAAFTLPLGVRRCWPCAAWNAAISSAEMPSASSASSMPKASSRRCSASSKRCVSAFLS